MIPTSRTAVEQIGSLFADYGNKHYGEACTQLEHAISCAQHGVRLEMPTAIVVAALLHDIGHFIADRDNLPGFDQWGYAAHDSLGADYLQTLGFDSEVTEPIRLHVAAKRYLAAVENIQLSKASAATLQQQGGAMTPGECQQFRSNPWYQQALQLRHLDDLGKPEESINTDLQYWLAKVEHYLSNNS